MLSQADPLLPYPRSTRTTHHGRAWSASMLGVAAGSVAFHSTSGCWRLLGRKADYWAIAASSCER